MRVLVGILILLLAVPADLLASVCSAAIVSVRDGVSDNISYDLVSSFNKSLTRGGMAVVSHEKVNSIMQYYEPVKKDAAIDPAADALISAKEHYYNFDYEEAVALVGRSINIMLSDASSMADHGTLLRDAYITAGIIEKSSKGRDETAYEYFKQALQVDPHYAIDEKAFTPTTVELFNRAMVEVLKNANGSIRANTDPMVAEVYLNGVFKGVTPISLSLLPDGNYNLSIRTNKYATFEKNIEIRGGNHVQVKERLNWIGDNKDNSVEEIGETSLKTKDQIEEGLRIAELLRVQKVVMVNADEHPNGEGEISIRMIDRKYKASHNPIVVRYGLDKKGLARDLSHANALLIKQSHVNILNDPIRNVDPDGMGDIVLLGKRKRALYTMPLFWGVVGGVVAASAGGAAAAVASNGGSSSAPGSVNVKFK